MSFVFRDPFFDAFDDYLTNSMPCYCAIDNDDEKKSIGWRLSELGRFGVWKDWMCHLLPIIIYSPFRMDLEKGRWLLISHFYPVQWFCHDREIHTNDSECRENTWNDPAFHSLLSLHSFHSQWVPFISINCIPISSFESPFHCFHSLSHQYHPSISIPLHFNHIQSTPSTTPPPSTHSHTTATIQFRSNTHTPFCVELGTPNTNNSRKPLDPCVCLFKAHTFF